MKIVSALFGFLIFTSGLLAQSWYSVSEPDIKHNLSDIFFINENEGWAVGDSGIVMHTINAGQSWEFQNAGTKSSLKKIFFLDNQYGWAGTTDGSIIRTTDGGKNWSEISFAHLTPGVGYTYFDGLQFTSPLNGHIIAGKYKQTYLFRTTDGGLNWEKKDSLYNVAARWYDLNFSGTDKGVLVGDKKDKIKYTTDGGAFWKPSTAIVDGFFRDQKAVRWLGENIVISMGEGNEFQGIPTPIYKSTDGGVSWVKKAATPAFYDRIKDAYFKNGNEGIAVGSNGFSKMFYAKTADGGETWTPFQGNFGMSLQGITGSGDKLFALGTDAHILVSSDFGGSWNMLKMKPPSSIYDIQFINGKGYAMTRNSDLLISSGGTGDNWSFEANAGSWESGSMYFIDENTGFMLKQNRMIVKTTDGGKTWKTVLEPVPFNDRNKMGGITFGDAMTGYAWMSINDYGEYFVFKTTDGGNNWAQQYYVAGPGYISGKIDFFDASTGFIAGPKGWMMQTTDGGQSWNASQINGLPANLKLKDFEDAVIIDNSHAWAVADKSIWFTSDKGASWNYVNHGLTDFDSTFYTIAFYGDTLGYVGCFDGVIIKTTDGGKSWSMDISNKGKHAFYSSAFDAQGRVFFGTSTGKIIAGEKVSGVERDEHLPAFFSLEQNYPNPFNPITSIRFTLAGDAHASLTVFNVMGQQVARIADGYFKSGQHNVNFDASRLSSGVYYYQLKSGGFIETKKMTLLK